MQNKEKDDNQVSSVTKSAGVVGISVLLSRITGLLREMTIAAIFGAGVSTDAFFVAFRIPATLRQLFAEGGINAAFIPVLSGYKNRKKDEIERFSGNVITVFSLIILVVILIVELFPGAVVDIFASGLSKETFALAVLLTKMVFPYIWLISMVSFLGGILNTYGYFFAPAISQAILNLTVIAFAFVMGNGVFGFPPITALAYGILTGGLLQLLLQIFYLPKTKLNLKPVIDLHDKGLREVFKLLIPTLLGVMVYQLNVLVSTQLASYLEKGSISFLYYADRLIQLPIGIFAFAISTATLPALSIHHAEHNKRKATDLLMFSLKLNFFLVIPVMFIYLILSKEIVDILYRRGAFSVTTTKATAFALQMYALGLWSSSGVRVLAPFFLSKKEPTVPLTSSSISLVTNFVLSLILMRYMQFAGLALSVALASMTNFTILFFIAQKKDKNISLKIVMGSSWKIVLSASIVALILFVSKQYFPYPFSGRFLIRLFWLTVMLTLAGVTYIFFAKILKINEMNFLWNGIKKKLHRQK